MDNQHPAHSDNVPSHLHESHLEGRFKDDPHGDHVDIWTAEEHAETSVEKNVRLTLQRIHIIGGIVAFVCGFVFFLFAWNVYHRTTYVDPVNPDYSLLDINSITYWTDRILLDIATAHHSGGTDQIRLQRLRRFAYRTLNESMKISSPYARAQAVTGIAIVLAKNDINIIVDHYLWELEKTDLIAGMRARALVSQALMHLRMKKNPAAQVTIQRYLRLLLESDIKLNTATNEEAFCGAVTVLRCLDDGEGLAVLFNHQKETLPFVSIDQQMRAYRLMVGEQIRIGLRSTAQETAMQIIYPAELIQAWALIFHYTARPPKIFPVEPTILDLPVVPLTEPPQYPYLAEQAVNEFFQYLAEHKDIGTQTFLLRRLADSRLMRDVELYKIFRRCVFASKVLDDQVKQPVLKLLDDPEAPAVRAALGLPPRTARSSVETPTDDWTIPDDHIFLEPTNVDSTPLRIRYDRQWIQAWLAVAGGYQSVKRFQEADRILDMIYAVTKNLADSDVRVSFLMQIGEQQLAVGSFADAHQTFQTAAPMLNQEQKGELVRLCVIGRLFENAQTMVSTIESKEIQEYAASFLLQEQIRIHDIQGAEKTLALLPQGKTKDTCRCRLNIARASANTEDFRTLGLPSPGENDQRREQHCIGLIRQGFLHTADRASDQLENEHKRIEIQSRIAREYQLLCQSFNDINDPNRLIRQSIRSAIMSIAERIGQPSNQTVILTELVSYISGNIQTKEDRTMGKQIWLRADRFCQRITDKDVKTPLFARLIVAKNLLEIANSSDPSYPFFTRGTNSSAIDEANILIEECLELINSMRNEEQQGIACASLAMALAQVGRIRSAQTLHNRVLEIVPRLSDYQKSVPMLLAMIPALKAMDAKETITAIYRSAIDEVVSEFSGMAANVDVYEWRMRDSEIEWIIRSQMENGFLSEAVESTIRLNEPVLRDRLLRSAAYICLDQGDVVQAELEARRITVKSIQSEVLQNIQVIRNQSKIRSMSNDKAY